jgi:ribosome-associated heat shock protein Hsp15
MADDSVRLDKWLWAARFFKTRSAATDAVHGGKVQVNGEHAKAARAIKTGDTVRLRVAPYEYELLVTDVAARRGSAAAAAALYRETDASRTQRERLRDQARRTPNFEFSEGKPDKKQRRDLRKLKGG